MEMAEVIRVHKESGGTWFNPERMKFLRIRLNDKCDFSPLRGYDGHVYFCASMVDPDPDFISSTCRTWSVMRMLPDTDIEVVRSGLASFQARDVMAGLLPRR